jgi:hypothetical protein
MPHKIPQLKPYISKSDRAKPYSTYSLTLYCTNKINIVAEASALESTISFLKSQDLNLQKYAIARVSA